ncbi:MAG TPA: SDR family oxidoreductase [Candidatus Nanopelagicales bacterium]|nr:SDR family oxidoreductase [Candidatus Nanopelagicales bacterium]
MTGKTALSHELMTGKVILVVGGTQGLGAQIARRAAECGAEAVVVSGRGADKGRAVADELTALGTHGAFVQADVGEAEQALALVDQVVTTFGRVDCVANVAATTSRGSLVDTTPELFDLHLNVNLKGPFFVMQAAVKDMQRRSSPGTIVNILSIAAHGGQPYLAPYVASKAGLSGLTKNAAHAHRFDRIRINGVNIGWTITDGEEVVQRTAHGATDGWLEEASAQQPMGKLGQPDEIADFIVYLLSDRSGVVTGAILDWDQMVVGGSD